MGVSRYSNVNTKTKKGKFFAGVYLRVSVDDDDRDISNSIISQRNFITDFINMKKDIELFDYYTDDGFSGTNFNRPGFKKMLQDIANRKINTVIVKDLSRFGRNKIVVGNFLEEIFPAQNIRFISISDNIDSYENPDSINNISVPFKNLINDEYARDMSKKVKSSWIARVKNGENMITLSNYGYLRSNDEKHSFIIDKNTAPIVKRIFDEYVIDDKSSVKIARELREEGIMNPSTYKCKILKYKIKCRKQDNFWISDDILKILKQPNYTGDLYQGKTTTKNYRDKKTLYVPKENWYVTKNAHEPIISKEMFEKAQQKLSGEHLYKWKYEATYENIFRDVIKCGNCGSRLTRKLISTEIESNGNVKRSFRYSCIMGRKIRDSVCNCTIHEDDLKNVVLKLLKIYANMLADYKSLIDKSSLMRLENINEENENKIIILQNKIDKSKELIRNFYEDFKSGIINENDYKNYSDEQEKEVEKYENQIKELTNEMSGSFNQLDGSQIERNKEVLKFMDELIETKNLDFIDKNIVDKFIDKIYIFQDNRVEIVFKYENQFQKIFNMYLENV